MNTQGTQAFAARLARLAALPADRIFTAREVAAREELSRRTIRRTFEFARDQLNWPLEPVPGKGWRLKGRVLLCECCQRNLITEE